MAFDLLARTGMALYGDLWQSALARDLGISHRHFSRMVAGETRYIPEDLADRLRPIVAARRKLLDAVAREIENA